MSPVMERGLGPVNHVMLGWLGGRRLALVRQKLAMLLLRHTGRLRLSALPGGAWAAAAEAAEPAAASTSGRSAADEAAERLDALMEVLFAHLGRRVASGQAADAWATLLGAFEAHLLAVPRSKFTQYALWFLADKARPGPAHPELVY